ncbi:hypothetical protein GC163_21215 [bacterium]|nr:hypothetical protein [bacterium]
MRARNIKPAFFRNELLAELPAATRLLFIGLWCLADREGRLEDRPKRIKLELLPFDEIDIEQALSDLETQGFIKRYVAEGVSVIRVSNFVKHQTPHGTEKDSELPDEQGQFTVHQRGKHGYITGAPQLVNSALTVNPPFHNALNPDYLNPDSNTPLPPTGGDADEDQTPEQPPVQRAPADKPRPKRSKKLSKTELRDTPTVLAWLKTRSKKLRLDPDHHETRLRTLATAEGALRSDGPGFFEACMRNQRWEMLSDGDLATGKRRLQEHDTSHLPGLVNQLSNKLAISTIPGIDDAECDDDE